MNHGNGLQVQNEKKSPLGAHVVLKTLNLNISCCFVDDIKDMY